MPDSTYRPPFWYRGRHLQTLWGPLFRHWRPPPLRRERLETPDGDFVDLDWLEGPPRDAPLVLVLHGREGSARSHYARGLLLGAGRPGGHLARRQRRAQVAGRARRGGSARGGGGGRDLDALRPGRLRRRARPRVQPGGLHHELPAHDEGQDPG